MCKSKVYSLRNVAISTSAKAKCLYYLNAETKPETLETSWLEMTKSRVNPSPDSRLRGPCCTVREAKPMSANIREAAMYIRESEVSASTEAIHATRRIHDEAC